ncbi:MAG: hypothetical protein D6780_07115 [Candidatus Dadabacteria bacterium]|nr:MAG: hypothetical protein D6780_07115 [Candidatus Dadabacteria bacterium]
MKKAERRSIIIGALLCGGASARMGTNKAFLKYKEFYFVEKALNILNRLKEGGYLKKNFLCGSLPRYSCIPDKIKGIGPLSGIYSLLESEEVRGFLKSSNSIYGLFIPVDMPLLTAEDLLYLIQNLKDFDYLLKYRSFTFPFLIKFTQETKKIIKERALQKNCVKKQYSLAVIFNDILTKFQLNYREIEPLSQRNFLNVNYREEYLSLLKGAL